MNKIVVSILLMASMSFAYDIKPADISFSWTGFKTVKKVGVSGVFDEVKYTIPRKTNKSLSKALVGAKAVMITKSVNIGNNKLKYKNVYGSFFKAMKNETIEVSIYKVIEGTNLGTLSLKVKMNNRTNIVPMQYTIENNVLKSVGVIDVLDFALSKQHKALAKACNPFHGGLTWTQVALKLDIKL